MDIEVKPCYHSDGRAFNFWIYNREGQLDCVICDCKIMWLGHTVLFFLFGSYGDGWLSHGFVLYDTAQNKPFLAFKIGGRYYITSDHLRRLKSAHMRFYEVVKIEQVKKYRRHLILIFGCDCEEDAAIIVTSAVDGVVFRPFFDFCIELVFGHVGPKPRV